MLGFVDVYGTVNAVETSSKHDGANRAIRYAFSIPFSVLPSRLFQLGGRFAPSPCSTTAPVLGLVNSASWVNRQ